MIYLFPLIPYNTFSSLVLTNFMALYVNVVFITFLVLGVHAAPQVHRLIVSIELGKCGGPSLL